MIISVISVEKINIFEGEVSSLNRMITKQLQNLLKEVF